MNAWDQWRAHRDMCETCSEDGPCMRGILLLEKAAPVRLEDTP